MGTATQVRVPVTVPVSSDTVDPGTFAGAMRALPAGVVVVTTLVEGRPWGVTLSSLSSFSAAPARVAFSILRTTATATHLQEHGTFGVSILRASAADLASRQAAPGQPKFLDEERLLPDLTPRFGLPRLTDALVNLECRVACEMEVLDHILIVADVLSMSEEVSAEPALVYVNRTFGRFTADAA